MRLFKRLESLPGRLADLIVGHPLIVLAILLAATAVAGYSARNLRFDFNPDAVFSSDNREIAYAAQFRREFNYDDTVIIIGLQALGKDDVVTAPALTWQAQMVRDLEHLPKVKRVESLISMKTPRVTLGLNPKLSYEPIIDEIPVSKETAEVLRERLAETELPFGSLVSRDYKMAALLVVFDATESNFDAMRSMVRQVDATLAQHAPPPGDKVLVSGLPVLRVGIVNDLQKDQVRLMPLAGVLYLITLALAFRSISGSLLPLFAVGQGLIWTFGVIAFRGAAAQYREQHPALHATH